MRLLQSLVYFILLSGPAVSDVYTNCNKAIELGELGTIQRLSFIIMKSTPVSDPKNWLAGEQCLTFAYKKQYIYDVTSGTFVEPHGETAALKLKQADVVSAIKSDAARKAATEQLQSEQKDLLAELEQQKARRDSVTAAEEAAKIVAVLARVSEVCNELYAADPTEALTRQVCLDVFLIAGLPSE